MLARSPTAKPRLPFAGRGPLSALSWFAGICSIWLAIALITSLQNYVAALATQTPQPWLPGFGNNLAWYAPWALLTPAIVAVARRLAGRRLPRLLLLHGLIGLGFGVAHAALYSAINALVNDGSLWAPWSSGLMMVKLTTSVHVSLMIYAIIVGIVIGIGAYRTMRDREVTSAKLETQLAEAETAALRAQLQPHFLFNTLNAISALVPDDPVTAQRLIARLGDLLRLSIDRHRSQRSTLADEFDFTDMFLAIEEARLGSRLRVVRRVAPETMTDQVPTLLLQPLVENAVRHGIAAKVAGGTLELAAEVVGDRLRITVADDGVGADLVIEGVGLGNTRQRLRQLYGDSQSLEIDTAAGGGFRVTVSVPR